MAVTFITIMLLITMTVNAYASTQAQYEITISPPSMIGAPATIRVDDGTGLVAAQAKLGDTGDWLDLPTLIAFGWAHFDLPDSGRVYVSLTDDRGNIHVASEQVDLPPGAVPPPPPAAAEPEIVHHPYSSVAVQPPTSSTAGMPGATGNVYDNLTAGGEIREFFTITTDNGGVFFLVVDRPSGGVHLLSAVDEHDLAGFINENRRQPSIGSSPPSAVHPAGPVDREDEAPKPEPQPQKQSGINPIPITLIMLAAGGVAYYWKIYRPKQAGADDYEDEENPSESEDSGPDMEFETERDEGEDDDYGDEDFYDERGDLEPV